tara:strand:- start:391 stop:1008 length:618 start_codon:yes stop_codon:yes gene_type:complete
MKVSVINCGYGNIGSVMNMLKKIGVDAEICVESTNIKNSTHIILPGVGSFDRGMKKLKDRGFYDAIQNDVKKFQIPFLGICLGMQFLFKHSDEGTSYGLDLIPGKLEKFDLKETGSDLKVPHMGWNYVNFSDSSKLGKGLKENSRFYFVHSYCYKNTKSIYCKGFTDYGENFTSVIENENFFGVQFHPEKSLNFGIKLFKNFLKC